MPEWLIGLLGAAGLALAVAGAKLGSWWTGRQAAKEKARLESEVEKISVLRDAAEGKAAVSDAKADVLAEHVETRKAADEVAREVRDVASSADPADRVAAVDDWVRKHEDGDRKSPVPGSRRAPTVRDR